MLADNQAQGVAGGAISLSQTPQALIHSSVFERNAGMGAALGTLSGCGWVFGSLRLGTLLMAAHVSKALNAGPTCPFLPTCPILARPCRVISMVNCTFNKNSGWVDQLLAEPTWNSSRNATGGAVLVQLGALLNVLASNFTKNTACECAARARHCLACLCCCGLPSKPARDMPDVPYVVAVLASAAAGGAIFARTGSTLHVEQTILESIIGQTTVSNLRTAW